MKLFEVHKQGQTFYETDHRYLYHLTDHHGFAYTVDQNALRAMRQGYVSTTYDANKNGVFGYSHYDFKFVLDGKALVSEYGGFNYDHHIMVGDAKNIESLDEREIGIETGEIEPFSQYLLGTQLLFPIFSQKSIQWLLYDNKEMSGWGTKRTQAPRTIETLYKVMVEWKKPIWVYDTKPRKMNAHEMQFIEDVLKLHNAGANFDEGMRELSAKYPIKDHWDKDLDRRMVERRQQSEVIYKALNKYYQGRPYQKVDTSVVRNLITKAINVLGLGNNIESVVLGAIEEQGLFHQMMAPVDWGIILKPLMDGDVEDALEHIQWTGREKASHKRRYDADPEQFAYSNHVGTRF